MEKLDLIEISSTSSEENVKTSPVCQEVISINSSSESECAESEDGLELNELCYDADAEGDAEAANLNNLLTAARSTQFGNPEPKRKLGPEKKNIPWSTSESDDSDYENKIAKSLEDIIEPEPKLKPDQQMGLLQLWTTTDSDESFHTGTRPLVSDTDNSFHSQRNQESKSLGIIDLVPNSEDSFDSRRNQERGNKPLAVIDLEPKLQPGQKRLRKLWSATDSSDGSFSEPVRSTPGPSKRSRLSEEAIDVAASASNVEPSLVDEEVELASPTLVNGSNASRSDNIVDEIEDETAVVALVPPPQITFDFRVMNQRMHVLERSMRYVAAQIVAMTANRPSPANMRLWAQQQCRAEQERIAQTPNYSGNHTPVPPEMQAQLQLQIRTQVEAEVQALDEEDDDVQILPEQTIREYLENNTHEFNYSTNSTRETKCIICFEDFEKDISIRRLRCEHCFHRHCIDHWFTTSQLRCPMCRANVTLD